MAGSHPLLSIPPDCHSEAFGTYCMSGPAPEEQKNEEATTHLVDVWLQTEAQSRVALLSICAGLLCRDEDGKLLILSAPRLCLYKTNDGVSESCIVAHKGNALDPSRNEIVWIPVDFLLKEFKTGHGSDDMSPAVLPLEFGHGIDMDLSNESLMRVKLTVQHTHYHTWIQKTARWFKENKTPDDLAVPVSTQPRDSRACILLEAELERIRFRNLEKWLEKQNDSGEETPEASFQEAGTRDHLVDVAYEDEQETTTQGTAETVRNEDKQPGTTTSEDSPMQSVEYAPVSSPTLTTTTAPTLLDCSALDNAKNAMTLYEPLDFSRTTALESSTFRSSDTSPKSGMKQSFEPGFFIPESDQMQCPSLATDCTTEEDAGAALPDIHYQPPPVCNLLGDDKCAAEHGPVAENPKKRYLSDLPQVGAKKQRSSLGETEGKIVKAFAEFLAMEKEEVPKLFVAFFAGKVNPESLGFKTPLKKLLDDGLVKNAKGGMYSLTNKGRGYIPEEINPPKDNSEFHKRLLPQVLKKKGATTKMNSIWKELGDGKKHDIVEVANAAGNTNSQSIGFKSQIDILLNLGFVEKQGSYTKGGTLTFKKLLFPIDETLVIGQIVSI